MRLEPYLVHMETTTAKKAVAARLIRTVLQEGLAANAWLSSIESHYESNGSIRKRREHFVAFKTTPRGRMALLRRLRELHDEDAPYIGWLKLHEMPKGYARWVSRRSGAKSRR